jgi:hypothetical protein
MAIGCFARRGTAGFVKGLLEKVQPRAVVASRHAQDGQRIEDSFLAISSPGYRPGHVAYFTSPAAHSFAATIAQF